ncbi:MAG: hypothetical protein ABI702_01555 [Burkholderiales bacterium]
MNWKLPLAAAVVAIAGGATLYLADGRRPTLPQASGEATHPMATPAGALPTAKHDHDHQHDHDAPAAALLPRISAPLNAQARASMQDFDRLRDLAPGDAAIALGRQLEAAITPDNAAGYVQALLKADNAAVERSAIAALARSADSALMIGLAGEYSAMPPEHRGRVLQILEGAANPAATDGLIGIVAADTSEKRSPLVMSAMYGIANIGTMAGVQYLLGQVSPGNADFALMALERVRTPQGIEMIRAAAEGSKDADAIAPAFRPALRRIADAAGKP